MSETLAAWCDRPECRQAPDDTITVAMFRNAAGTYPWVHERCTRPDPPPDDGGQLDLT